MDAKFLFSFSVPNKLLSRHLRSIKSSHVYNSHIPKYAGYLSNSAHACPSTKFYDEESHFLIFELWTIRFNFILSRSQYLRFIRSFLIELVEECCTCFILATGCVFSCFLVPVLTFFTIYIYTGQFFFGFFSGCSFRIRPRDGMTRDLENYLLSSKADLIDSSEEYPPSFMNMW